MSMSRLWFGLMALSLGCGQTSVIIDSDSGAPDLTPDVLLLVDTSGSMAWKANCACTSGGCEECLPDCSAGERPRWHDVLAAISGSYKDYTCEALERTQENGATYDIGYPKPFYRVAPETSQLSDGLLDRYGSEVFFGLATFDAMRTLTGLGDLAPHDSIPVDEDTGESGQFSYPGNTRPDGTMPGKLGYPSSDADLFIDSGIVSQNAPEGALVVPRTTNDAVAKIKHQLQGVRLYGGTPTASALDDLYFVYADNRPSSQQAKSYILFITDGQPDDDFREYPTPGCDCAARGDCGDADPRAMSCPYPTAADAAKHLHCGFDAAHCVGAVARIEVVTYAVNDTTAKRAVAEIAESGNGAATPAVTPAQLTSALNAAMKRIIKDSTTP